ncbi:2-C-methyl-D-erythritol 4-phosphate cytidylyltransferase [uncultured Desulfosarcina sp.]|uniref:2-C-methyl-D-erythritol 4-phosphate cytidylyltransferase n=1 Tax=uncultured Desulfosarcina sp. TaxID=218289 RepID=UPI0029C8A0CC|nr:2-C-methyl-D-erythritol 4-phosphate cytidylyltransferase [uncultured Desulfosarcina sp.]
MICAVIVAGGSGSRMKAPMRKQYLNLDGVPIVAHTLMAFDRRSDVDRIILVVPENDLQWCRDDILAPLCLDHDIQLAAGGRRRQDSVFNGLTAVGASGGTVMIHDGVRPFVGLALMNACLDGVKISGGCVPAIPATDTLKQVDANGRIIRTLDRQQIRLAQTPQTFSLDLIRNAHRLARQRGFTGTDDASIAEFAGETVTVVDGDPDNIKITTPEDLSIATVILARWRAQASG